ALNQRRRTGGDCVPSQMMGLGRHASLCRGALMNFLGRFRVLTKIVAIVSLLALLTATVAYIAITALANMNANAENMAMAGDRALVAARITQNVIALNRAEFRAAIDPRDENRKVAQKLADDQLKLFKQRMEELKKTPDPQARAMLPALDEAWAAYEQTLNATMAAATDAASGDVTETAKKLLQVVIKSREAAENLQSKVRAIAERLD